MRIKATPLRWMLGLALTVSVVSAGERTRLDIQSRPVEWPVAARITGNCGPLDVIEVIDRSGSMSGPGIVNARNAARYLISILNPVLDRVGLVSFNQAATVQSSLTTNFTLVDSQVAALVASGGTDVAAAITAGHAELASPIGRPILVLFSDGASAELPMRIAAANARAAGIEVIIIAYAGGISPYSLAVLQSMATSPAHFFLVNTTDDLRPLLDLLHVQICACGDGASTPPEMCDDGNTVPNDGCTSCQVDPVCGNGTIEPWELCDDGSHCENGIPCTDPTTCVTIGDGLCRPRQDDYCTDGCLARQSLCGNGILEPPEECDDGNPDIGDGCDGCFLETCGDGRLDPGEQCDDGDRDDGDGCSRNCTAECADSDGGIIIDVAGTLVDGAIIRADNCTSATVLEEWYCGPRCPNQGGSGVQARFRIFDCVSLGFTGCVAGACVPPNSVTPLPSCSFFCGNGSIEAGEVCDDGNQNNGDGCNSICQPEILCGNGIVEPPEHCDDGNNTDDDGCTAFCFYEGCGDGIVQPWEECDDGNTIPGDGCSTECNVEAPCGDGRVDPHEECDPAPPSPLCIDCLLTRCGDATVQTPNGTGLGGPSNDGVEACDDGNLDPADLCDFGCRLTRCGDGVLQLPNGTGIGGPSNNGTEACDDANTNPADLCNANCTLTTCGDGVIQVPNGTGTGGPSNDGAEGCDDANTNPADLCNANCVLTTCGDGVVQVPNGTGTGGPSNDGAEGCDDANTNPADLCNANCVLTTCGDGVMQAPNGTGTGGPSNDGAEACDDANTNPADLCNANCILTTCGDGVLQAPNGTGIGGPSNDGAEGCDDANTNPADLCNANCILTTCGDGVVQAPNGTGTGGPSNDGAEGCDDANTNPADLCNANCVLTTCGDGVVQAPNGVGTGGPSNDGVEACDDGNAIPGDGCGNCVPDVTLSVTWDYLRASCSEFGRLVEWSVLEEDGTVGYEVRASTSANGPWTVVSPFIMATGSGSSYQHAIRGTSHGTGPWYSIVERCVTFPACDTSTPFELQGDCMPGTTCDPVRPSCPAGWTCACSGQQGSRPRGPSSRMRL